MRYKEILGEYVEQVRDPAFGTVIPVQVNPTSKTLRDFLEQSDYQELRGLFDEQGKFYFWDAGHLIHGEMADQLGIDMHNMKVDPRLVVKPTSFGGGPIVAMYTPKTESYLENSSYFNKVFTLKRSASMKFFTLKV